jgi:hypothetical protein
VHADEKLTAFLELELAKDKVRPDSKVDHRMKRNSQSLAAAAQPLTHAGGRARVSLLKEIKLSDDGRAHAWILSHYWPEQFSESQILQPVKPT